MLYTLLKGFWETGNGIDSSICTLSTISIKYILKVIFPVFNYFLEKCSYFELHFTIISQ